jgi:hypothetical protein
MKWLPTSLLLCFTATVIAGIICLWALLAPPDVTVYAAQIPRQAALYSDVTIAEDPETNAYCYQLNSFVRIPGINTSKINTANDAGAIPVFNFDDTIFFVLYKGRNYSRGLALSKDVLRIANEFPLFEFKKIDDSLFYWEMDGQRNLQSVLHSDFSLFRTVADATDIKPNCS